jgi:hypothetical protein
MAARPTTKPLFFILDVGLIKWNNSKREGHKRALKSLRLQTRVLLPG